MEGLTLKQEKYVQELLKGKSQREAYKAAFDTSNMKDKTVDEKASRLFATNKVRTRYQALRDRLTEETEKEAIVTVKEVLKDLVELRDKCMGRLPVSEQGDKAFNPAGANRALELLGKHLGMYEERVKMDATANVTVEITGEARKWAE